VKILMVTSEIAPYAKSGGLADAVSSIARSLAAEGHDVRVILPRYYFLNRDKLTKIDGPLGVPIGAREEWTAVYTADLPAQRVGKKKVIVYFIDHEGCYGRDGIYGIPSMPDFPDNPRRFALLAKAAFQLCRKIDWIPDILHAHDWPAGLAPVYLRFSEHEGPFKNTKSVFTIHNLGYQGIYPKEDFPVFRLPWEQFHDSGLEDFGRINLLKAGLTSANFLTTVSPTYAKEIQTKEYGWGMEGILRARSGELAGILNGVDYDSWNPETDTMLPFKYTTEDLAGKAKIKDAIQRELGLPPNPDVPLVGMITRLADQKGIGELFGPSYGSAYSICSDMKLQFAVLGNGEKWCEDELRNLEKRLPNFRAVVGFNNRVSHLIEAGSDFFLMPSRYEPCGLNQMYSLRYGTLPIVRKTGGLGDTVEQYNQDTGSGTGFMFDKLTPRSIYDTVGWAVWAYYNRPDHIAAMRKRAMKKDFSWARAAKEYESLYVSLVKHH